jgi:hypothetical protein
MYRRSLLCSRADDRHIRGSAPRRARGLAYVGPATPPRWRSLPPPPIPVAGAAGRAFLLSLDLAGGARFPRVRGACRRTAAQRRGRWVVAPARAAGLETPRIAHAWRDRADLPGGRLPATTSATQSPHRGRAGLKATIIGRFEARRRDGWRVGRRRSDAPGTGACRGRFGRRNSTRRRPGPVRPFSLPASTPPPAAPCCGIVARRGQPLRDPVPSEDWSGGADPWDGADGLDRLVPRRAGEATRRRSPSWPTCAAPPPRSASSPSASTPAPACRPRPPPSPGPTPSPSSRIRELWPGRAR